MSLRKAIASLPDDRDTAVAVREVLAYLVAHQGESIHASRVGSATGLGLHRVEPVMGALSEALVISCDGEPAGSTCTFLPDSLLLLEVRRFLRGSGGPGSRLRRDLDRFRDRRSIDST